MEVQPITRDDNTSDSNAVNAAQARYCLVMQCSNGTEREFGLSGSKTIIGRTSHCDIHVALPAVHNRHCELEHHDNGLKLTDLGSDSGTYHNGDRVETAAVTHGDRIVIGQIEFTIRDRHAQPKGVAEVVVVQRQVPSANT